MSELIFFCRRAAVVVVSRDLLVVRTLPCGRSNPDSNDVSWA